MTTQLSIDTTIISTIISAAVAILVACVTVTLTLRSNRKLENEKHLKQKKKMFILFISTSYQSFTI